MESTPTIYTKFLPRTRTRYPRVKATTCGGYTKTIKYGHEGHKSQQEAAQALLGELGWDLEIKASSATPKNSKWDTVWILGGFNA